MWFPSFASKDKMDKLKIAGFFIYILGALAFGIALVVMIAKT